MNRFTPDWRRTALAAGATFALAGDAHEAARQSPQGPIERPRPMDLLQERATAVERVLRIWHWEGLELEEGPLEALSQLSNRLTPAEEELLPRGAGSADPSKEVVAFLQTLRMATQEPAEGGNANHLDLVASANELASRYDEERPRFLGAIRSLVESGDLSPRTARQLARSLEWMVKPSFSHSALNRAKPATHRP